MRVCHVITGLSTGGAEMMLFKLLTANRSAPTDALVVSLLGDGTIGPRLVEAGIPVRSLGMRRAVPSLAAFLTLRRVIGQFQPHLVQGWMYHGNLAASAAVASSSRRVPVVWNIRQTVYRLADNSPATATLIRLGATLSRHPRSIIYNSFASRMQHRDLGYDDRRATVIPNGFDLERFRPDDESRRAVRAELGIPEGSPVIGMIARYDPMKDFPNMVKAFARVIAVFPDAHLVLAGRDVTAANVELAAVLRAESVVAHAHLLGEVVDTPRMMAGLDVLCAASAWGEGFPNVLGEAMACGVPCVATDVGDSARLIGETGIVVGPRDATALGDAVVRILHLPADARRTLGHAARERVRAEFALDTVVSQYDDLYQSLVDAQQPYRART
jgi:glycosyltransferase involved in cell wall biosynthesis